MCPPPSPLPPPYCLSALLSACGPDASFLLLLLLRLPASLCSSRHTYKEGAHGGGDTRLDFLWVCLCSAGLLALVFPKIRYSLHITPAPGAGGWRRGEGWGGGSSARSANLTHQDEDVHLFHLFTTANVINSSPVRPPPPPPSHQVNRQKFRPRCGAHGRLPSLSVCLRPCPSVSVSVRLSPSLLPSCLSPHSRSSEPTYVFALDQPSANTPASIRERGDDRPRVGHRGHAHPSIHKVHRGRRARACGWGWIVRV